MMVITVILLSTLFSNFASSVPNLCDIPRLAADGSAITDSTGQHLARYCQWTGPDAPVLDSEVCCEFDDAGAACSLPDVRGGCLAGERYWCEHGEASVLGEVVCYQPLRDACEAGYCVAAPEDPPTGEPYTAMCCGPGGCIPASVFDVCDGEYVICEWGISNADGTVECFD